MGASGSCKCITSNPSCLSNSLILGRNHTDKDIRAVDPPVGTGTDLPNGINPALLEKFGGGPDRGAMILTWCPDFSRPFFR